MIQWKWPETKVDKTGNFVRGMLFLLTTGSIELSVWEDHNKQVQEQTFYTFTDCKLRYYFAKSLTTTKTTEAKQAEAQDLSIVQVA